MDNTEDELVSTRAPIETAKPHSQPYTATSHYSSSDAITASTSTLSPSAALPYALTQSSKSHKKIKSTQ